MTLNRLGEPEIAALIDSVTGDKSVAESIRQDIIERADGIPLFIEEMTKAALEAGEGDAAEQLLAAIPSQTVAVPASLHASLMARLDRLGPAKKVAQIGAVIGREFGHSLLAAVAQKPEPELRARSTGLLRQACSSERVWLRTRRTCSSTRLYRTRHTVRSFANRAVNCTPA